MCRLCRPGRHCLAHMSILSTEIDADMLTFWLCQVKMTPKSQKKNALALLVKIVVSVTFFLVVGDIFFS